MICRQGMITKADVGAIRIFDRETRFEVAEQAADGFLTAVRRLERGEVRIEPLPQDGREGQQEGRVRHGPPRQFRGDRRPPRADRAA